MARGFFYQAEFFVLRFLAISYPTLAARLLSGQKTNPGKVWHRGF
jgi:hypothetical protein